ncbi:hypothetical protein Ahy_A04g018778 isoform B [Arachis hypogaea]|uniref:Replication factor A C-terminal domain-containing protein n=1 Tax=Arachis hypogaea TaxID=3818 RepID=A0A445DEJ6_ARAHY|nr:hypothetical protein Ahy_A04g018778 isoform B [Arachis hypogaea]
MTNLLSGEHYNIKTLYTYEYGLNDRYKVEVIVYDGTDSMTLFLWDREAIPLFEKRADQIKEEEVSVQS